MEKVVRVVATIGAGLVANKVLSAAWKGITGHEPPVDEKSDEGPLAELVLFAAISGALVALARAYADRGASKWLTSGDIEK